MILYPQVGPWPAVGRRPLNKCSTICFLCFECKEVTWNKLYICLYRSAKMQEFILSSWLFFICSTFSWLFVEFLPIFKCASRWSCQAKKMHICSNLWTAPFLSSTSARYFHTIIISSMLDVHFARYRAHLMLCKHQSAFFLHFCTTILKLEKLEGYITGPPVSSPRTFLSFPGASIYIYIFIFISNITIIIYISM